MKVKNMIKILSELDQDADVVILLDENNHLMNDQGRDKDLPTIVMNAEYLLVDLEVREWPDWKGLVTLELGTLVGG